MKQASMFEGISAFGNRLVPSQIHDTSIEAKERIETRAGVLRSKCLLALEKGNYTADQVAALIGESVLSIRPRFTELLQDGKILDTGIRSKNESGRNAIVWRLHV